MADFAGDCFGGLCALCCICCATASESWCLFSKCGAGSNSGSGSSCCKRSFDDDDFEKEEARLHQQAREREQATMVGSENGSKGGDSGAGSTKSEDGSGVVRAQPAPAKGMEPPRRSNEGAVQ